MVDSENTNGYDNALMRHLRNLQIQVGKMTGANTAREQAVSRDEIQLSQGLEKVNGAPSLMANLNRFLPPYLVPGNLGDINRVIWPFWFTIGAPELPLATGGVQSQATGAFSVTQEAAFVMMAFQKAIFVRDPADPAVPLASYSWLDPLQATSAAKTPGLAMTITDAQSRRIFMNNPIELDHIGYAQEPTVLPTPQLFLPNSTVEVQFYNSDPAVTYVPWITFFGYRVRIEDAQNILSLVRG